MEIEDELDSLYQKNTKKIICNAKTEKIFRDYTCTFSRDITNYLIYNQALFHEKRKIKKAISVIQNTIKLCRIDQPLTVYHGTSSVIFENKKIESFLKVTDVFTLKSFISTSIYMGIGIKFSSKRAITEDHAILLQINLPKDYPALWLKPLSTFQKEGEVLLLNDTSFKIDDYEKCDNYTLVKVRPIN